MATRAKRAKRAKNSGSTNRPSRRRGWQTTKQIATIAIAATVALAARSSLADHYIVPSGSMLPTVHEGDRIVVDKLAYGFRLPFSQLYVTEPNDPSPGDVVVLISPESGIVLVKRIAAGPGDTVQVLGGQLVLNGEEVPVEGAEGGGRIEILGGVAHPVQLTGGGGPDFGPTTLGPDQYLVMGDNRGNSHDGRSFGMVDRDAIIGRAVARFYSDGALRWLTL